MIKRVDTAKQKITTYSRYLTQRNIGKLKNIAKKLRGKKILHINSTAQGGGVAELLKSLIPLERGLGLDCSWYVLDPDTRFFDITKKLHNSLQGSNIVLTTAEENYYLARSKKLAEQILNLKPDILVLHDPQPMAAARFLPASLRKIFRIHIDMSKPNPKTVQFMKPLFAHFNSVIFTMPQYVPVFARSRAIISPPAIDPLTIKNRVMPAKQAARICESLGLDIKRPMIAQISRFDVWKDPIGVVQAYQLIKAKFPKVQLVLAGLIEAQDDPEAKAVLTNVKKYAGDDPDIYIFSDKSQLGKISVDVFVNAIQTQSNIILQKSIREGFGLTVTEGMWKGKPVIGGDVGGIKFQIQNGKNGWLVKSPRQAAKIAVDILGDGAVLKRVGLSAHKTVANKFLITRFLADELAVMSKG